MTFLITAVANGAIFQSSDYMLTDPNTGRPYEDHSNKLVVFHNFWWEGMISYAGVGSLHGKSTADFIMSWLPKGTIREPKEVTEIVKTKGYLWLKGFFWKSAISQHEFIFSYFWKNRPYVQILSANRGSPAESYKGLTQRTITIDRGPTVYLSGSGTAHFTVDMGERLRDLLRAPLNPEAIRNSMRSLNKEVSRSMGDFASVSAECTVVSLLPGTGVPTVDGPSPIFHTPFTDGIQEIFNAMGASSSEVKHLGFARSGQAAPLECQASSVNVDDGPYELIEKTSEDFSSLQVTGVNTAGVAAGFGRSRSNQYVWQKWSGTVDLDILIGSGQTYGRCINELGQVAGTRHNGGQNDYSVMLWVADGAERLLRSADGFTMHYAGAITNDGVIWGGVGRDVGLGGWEGHLARWEGDDLHIISLDGVREVRPVSANNNGAVTMSVVTKEATLLPALYDEKSGFKLLSDGLISPIYLLDDETVIGDMNGTGVFYRNDGWWRPLGLPIGYSPSAANNRGDLAGYTKIDSYWRPWVKRSGGEPVLLPYLRSHHCRPASINDDGVIVGDGSTDHGSHALFWLPRI